MSRTKLLLDVVSDMRSLADSLETMANAVAGNDGVSKEKQADKPSVTHEMLRELAVKLSRNGKREEIKQLIAQLKKINPQIESNIFRSVENVNLNTIISYKKDDYQHSFLDDYDK